MKTINILGETQREQWHTIVRMLRLLGEDKESRNAFCDEIDRYIDFAEDMFEKMEMKKGE